MQVSLEWRPLEWDGGGRAERTLLRRRSDAVGQGRREAGVAHRVAIKTIFFFLSFSIGCMAV